MTDELTPQPTGYTELLGQLKERIRSAQLRAAMAVTGELVSLYWDIGRQILSRQDTQGWRSPSSPEGVRRSSALISKNRLSSR